MLRDVACAAAFFKPRIPVVCLPFSSPRREGEACSSIIAAASTSVRRLILHLVSVASAGAAA